MAVDTAYTPESQFYPCWITVVDTMIQRVKVACYCSGEF